MATVSDFMRLWDGPEPWIEAHTSGSTGTPKTIRLLKSDMISSARATNAFFGIGPDSVLALPLSVDYIAGKMMAVRARVAGCRLMELPVSNHIELPEGTVVDLLAVVPSQLPSLVQTPGIAGRVRHLLIGGAPVDDATARRVTAAGLDARLGYGMTETCSHVALRTLDSPVYTAMPGITFGVTPDGCLTISSDRFSWRRLETRDVVSLHGPDAFTWLGRADNTINSGGFKIHPEQVENTLRRALPWLPPFYIAGRPDSKWGTTAIMVAERDARSDDEILRAVHEALPDSRLCPRRIERVNTLPRTANGKLRR